MIQRGETLRIRVQNGTNPLMKKHIYESTNPSGSAKNPRTQIDFRESTRQFSRIQRFESYQFRLTNVSGVLNFNPRNVVAYVGFLQIERPDQWVW